MAKYQVALIDRPESWQPKSMDDVPPQPGKIGRVLAEAEEIFPAVRKAIEHNEAAQRHRSPQWAVVIEPGSLGKTWSGARLCTPLAYRVIAIWWPTGWEPQSPLDVPNCVWRAQGDSDQRDLSYTQAVAVLRGLNQQSMDNQTSLWYVIVSVENEPLSRSISYDPSGIETTTQVRRLHVVRLEEGGHGDCSHCPARSFDCAKATWASLESSMTVSQATPSAV